MLGLACLFMSFFYVAEIEPMRRRTEIYRRSNLTDSEREEKNKKKKVN